MRGLILALLVPALVFGASAAGAHAFLDHAAPTVGGTLHRAPVAVSIWFTQELEPAFSSIIVLDQAGNHVEAGEATVDAADATMLHVPLKPLGPGTYKVFWRVVSVDTHPTDGTFSFHVEGG
jgi:methionine-rich copper-binding protein CopC